MYQYHRFTHPCSRAVPVFFALLFLSWSTICLSSPATTVFINELHYDNSGPDTNEGIEIAGEVGKFLDMFCAQRYRAGCFLSEG